MSRSAESYDAVVVGAGPGGSTAATMLADAGYRVALIDQSRFPRYQIGESMIPYNYFPLERVGMIEKMQASDFPKKYSVQFVGRSGRQSQPFYFSKHLEHPCAQTWQVTRDLFDAMMVDNAKEHGVHVFEGIAVTSLLEEDGRITGATGIDEDEQSHTFRGTVTIDASGRWGVAMTQLNWRIKDPNLVKHALWAYVRGAKRDPGMDEGATTITYLEDKNWFWYIPLRDDLVSVGVVGDEDYLYGKARDTAAIFEREVAKNVWIEDHLATGVREGAIQGCLHESYRAKYCARDGLVLVGDALSFLDPVFSTGMYLTLASAELAADAVIEGLGKGDVSGRQFVGYGEEMCRRIEILRRLVYAFYARDFSFKQIIMKYPDLKGAVTDCLVGNLDRDFSALNEGLADFLDLPDPVKHGRALVT